MLSLTTKEIKIKINLKTINLKENILSRKQRETKI